ncbi:NAD-dependent deacetylase [Chitinophaga skermanii]|uniref:protein acetyllysine N-acetyltransferase n=1 Tax=Chitinophaga skermanii TaxID=331697 RepID=A0A327QRV6_9BACT|nr:Sir2 family NAD-dependent protein deacetylase [Chitinophaga skermanii]RAJ07011.1 NAD-dependent deacetylase [Chitinophaga skermanii]
MNNKLNLVVLTGAGISAESGIKTFRDSGGLWEGYDVSRVASPMGWQEDPALVLEFYNMRRNEIRKAKPNDAHKGLAALEERFNVHIITQNIDDLHERAGSSKVLHLHGLITQMRSVYDDDTLYDVGESIQLGDKAADGGQYRPHVVWFGEDVPMLRDASRLVERADIFVIIGTSLNVYPAAGLVDYVRGSVPRFVIDKKIPAISQQRFFTFIEKPATLGVAELATLI